MEARPCMRARLHQAQDSPEEAIPAEMKNLLFSSRAPAGYGIDQKEYFRFVKFLKISVNAISAIESLF
ncbi:MAG: hypothetical protein AAGE05_07420 [Pseudomonadota bacterium]